MHRMSDFSITFKHYQKTGHLMSTIMKTFTLRRIILSRFILAVSIMYYAINIKSSNDTGSYIIPYEAL